MPKKVCTVRVNELFIMGRCVDTETGRVSFIVLGRNDEDVLRKIAEMAGWELRLEPGGETAEELIGEAERQLKEAEAEEDLARKAEKGFLAATLAADAILISAGREIPSSLYKRKRMMEEVDPDLKRAYVVIVDHLYRTLEDMRCIPKLIESGLEEARRFVARARKVIAGEHSSSVGGQPR